jgi:hypothetical protein
MRRFAFALSCILFATATVAVSAQVASSANGGRRISITTGVMGSIFQPDFAGNWPPPYYVPVAGASNQPLFGAGAYVDVKLTRWVQIEAEGRWLRFNRGYDNIHEDNYLLGPRVPVYHFWRSTVYAKALGGFSKMDLGYGESGKFTDLAFGGGMDVKLTKRISFRAFDGEDQYWPGWSNSRLSPYGASMGIGYRIF